MRRNAAGTVAIGVVGDRMLPCRVRAACLVRCGKACATRGDACRGARDRRAVLDRGRARTRRARARRGGRGRDVGRARGVARRERVLRPRTRRVPAGAARTGYAVRMPRGFGHAGVTYACRAEPRRGGRRRDRIVRRAAARPDLREAADGRNDRGRGGRARTPDGARLRAPPQPRRHPAPPARDRPGRRRRGRAGPRSDRVERTPRRPRHLGGRGERLRRAHRDRRDAAPHAGRVPFERLPHVPRRSGTRSPTSTRSTFRPTCASWWSPRTRRRRASRCCASSRRPGCRSCCPARRGRHTTVPGSPYFVLVDGAAGRVEGEGTGTSWPQVRNLIVSASDDTRDGAGREARIDRELLAHGIAPGDPVLYPDGAPQ